MKKKYFPLLLLTTLCLSCNSNDEPLEEFDCQEDNNKVNMSRFVKSDVKSNGVSNSYTYNELKLLSSRKRASNQYVFEYDYTYDCSNNLIEIMVDETADPQYDGSSSYFEYDKEMRLVAYRNSFQGENDYTLTYDANVVMVSGSFWDNQTGKMNLHLNENGQVVRLDRDFKGAYYDQITYSVFDYDAAGNLIKIDDFDLDGILVNSISLNYDNNNNPYYEQFKSIYLQRFIQLFSQGGYWASDVISSDGFDFPYLPNNIISVVDNLCNACYPEVVKREYTYDDQGFPSRFSLSYWGAPETETEVQYE